MTTPEPDVMTTSEPDVDAPADIRVDRILTNRHVLAMVAADTVHLLADRVERLFSHGRRVALAQRYPDHDTAPSLAAGLGLVELVRHDHGGIGVYLTGAVTNRFGFHGHDHPTEEKAWAVYRSADRRPADLMYVGLTGGLPGDGPAADDRIVVTRWNHDGIRNEVVVAFDPEVGRG